MEQLSGQVAPGVELQVGLLPLGPWGEKDGGRPGVVQQQVILSQGQVDQRMQIAE